VSREAVKPSSQRIAATAALDRPLKSLRGVGPGLAGRLAKLGLFRVGDLLFHLPLRYEDRTRVTPIGRLRPGDRAVIDARVELAETVQRRRRALVCRVADGSGMLTLRFFHFSRAQGALWQRGARVVCYGEARTGMTGLEMVHPEYRMVAADAPAPLEQRLTPVYPATEGVSQARLRALVREALALAEDEEGLDGVPPVLLPAGGRMPLHQALEAVHRPPRDADTAVLEAGRHPAQRRLAFEELVAHQVSLRQLRRRARNHSAPCLARGGAARAALSDRLGFRLTGAQARVLGEVLGDLGHPRPMMRLVQGDVGSGKTVVAALAAVEAIASGWQAAVMAPTELLAEQHYRNFRGWLEALGYELAWLGGRLKGARRREMLERIADGRAQLVVGTHALFQEEVSFERLGLVVIDEQHRFGVHQRLALREKGISGGTHPHQLIMTATPIPRTLAMAAYADLDLSVIDELPPGRTPVVTVALPDSRRDEVIARVRDACRAGAQAYWVCTLIEESEALQARAAEDTAAALIEALPDLRVGLVHGRMKAASKEAEMRRFAGGEMDLLVATTVIEVGVDVPNATLMIVENPERLGLSQLHQLRGRVGRGSRRSNCVLMYHPPLGANARARLAVLRDSHDGFEIARRDLELRGPGELLGTRQTGELRLRVADLARDGDLMGPVQKAADEMLARHRDRVAPLVRRWVRDGRRYAEA